MAHRIGVYPGTFDPITLGHMDIISRGAKLVDELIIGVTTNIAKSPMFSDEERIATVEREVADCAPELAAWTGAPVTSFAAPYGAVNPAVIGTIARHYRFGFGTRLGRAQQRRDAHDLPRIEMHYFRDRRHWRGLLDGRNGYLRVRQTLRWTREKLGGGFG